MHCLIRALHEGSTDRTNDPSIAHGVWASHRDMSSAQRLSSQRLSSQRLSSQRLSTQRLSSQRLSSQRLVDVSVVGSCSLAPGLRQVLRRFPPVAGFVWTEVSFGNAAPQTRVANLQSGMNDPRVFPTPERFILRPLTDYHKFGVGFAEPSAAPHNGSPHSRNCPAKDLTFAILTAFLRAFVRTAVGVEGGHKALWTPEGAVTINGFGTNSFVLSRDLNAILPPSGLRSGEELLEALSPEEVLRPQPLTPASSASLSRQPLTSASNISL
jgi:hypothetical protein